MEKKDEAYRSLCPGGRAVLQGQPETRQRSQAMSKEGLAFAALTPLLPADLCWVKSREPAGVHYQLRTESDLVASLRFSDPLDSAATGESANGAWILVEEGLLRPHISVRTMPGDRPLAAYRSRPLGLSGYLDFLDGRRFCWKRSGLRTFACRFDNAQGTPLVAVEGECSKSWLFGSRLLRGFVRIEPCAYNLSELMPLVLLSWYLMVLPRNEAGFQCPA
jgi:hypothetical protein